MGWLHWAWFWFRKRWVATDTTIIIHQLYKLFHLKFPKERTYSFDHVLETWDRVVLRFPGTIASFLQLDGRGWPRSNKLEAELSLIFLCEFTDGISSLTRGNWQGFSRNRRTIKKSVLKSRHHGFCYYMSDYDIKLKWRGFVWRNGECGDGKCIYDTGSSDSELAYPLD